jgi:hypothetical protein
MDVGMSSLALANNLPFFVLLDSIFLVCVDCVWLTHDDSTETSTLD